MEEPMMTRALNTRLYCALALAIAGLLAGSEPAVAARHAQSASGDVTGLYRNSIEPDVLVVVYRDGGKLYEEGPRTPREELVETARDRFATAVDAVSFVFARNRSGV